MAAKPPSRPAGGRHKTKKTASESKQARVIEMLQSPKGATIEAMMKATGWQQHSVRGFLAGVVRNPLKLTLDTDKVDGVRCTGSPAQPVAAKPALSGRTSALPEGDAPPSDRSSAPGPRADRCRDGAPA